MLIKKKQECIDFVYVYFKSKRWKCMNGLSYFILLSVIIEQWLDEHNGMLKERNFRRSFGPDINPETSWNNWGAFQETPCQWPSQTNLLAANQMHVFEQLKAIVNNKQWLFLVFHWCVCSQPLRCKDFRSLQQLSVNVTDKMFHETVPSMTLGMRYKVWL